MVDARLRRAVAIGGYLLAGTVGTAVIAGALVPLFRPLQSGVYRAFYLAIGPWSATTAGSIIGFGLAGWIALGTPALLVEYRRSGDERIALMGIAFAGALGFLALALVIAALSGWLGLVTLVGLVALLTAGVLLAWYRIGVGRGAFAAVAGGIPVVALLFLALGFGLGWGGGYYLVAEEVAAPTDGTAADLGEFPAVREDLFDACDAYEEGVCRLPLRGYEHEARAARFLDRHGVRCPFLNARSPRDPGSFVAEHDGTYYRVTCVAFGD